MKLRPSIISLIFLGGIMLFACSGKEEEPRRLPRLNETLTNEMSDTSDLARLDRDMERYMQEWNLQGVSLSIMRNDSLVYSKGYGWADKKNDVRMSPGTILRLASVSKLVTAAGIMMLQERGQLSLSDKVFGDDGILNDSTFTSAIKDRRYFDITVEHLLRHQGGFTTNAGDPMFSTSTIMQRYRLKSPPSHETLVKNEITRRLGFTPGTSQSYSNFGFLLLSMAIEKITGEDYESWMTENVLIPAGCFDMHIAYNYYEEKYPNETRYHMQENDELVEEYNGSRTFVERCYGGNDIRALSGAGAWVASTAELSRFVASIDGRPEVPDILSIESVREMTRYINDETYSLGWNDTKESGEWTRTGTFSGTSALIKYYPDGECWIFVSNTGTWRGPRFANHTAELFRNSRTKYSALLPARDFFTVSGEEE